MKIDIDAAIDLVQRLALLRYFPNGNPQAVLALAEELCEWCGDTAKAYSRAPGGKHVPKQQAETLVKRALADGEWRGIGELKAMFLDLYPPPRKVSTYGNDPNAQWIEPWTIHNFDCVCNQCGQKRRG